ncbi:hypothetical protein [Enterococcus gallinarum]|uniref:hypothetical protein n=1 Tax=Enterococcus gallinarum TaxID=1353 RepID=UPI0018CE8432|nr:hypothetical protein [Enterococcus gallinarum]
MKFINFIETSKIQTRGPLITCSKGTTIDSLGDISTNYSIMIQTVREQKIQGFKIEKSLKVKNCLYVRYTGTSEDFSYAQTKLDLYIWENNLIETGYIYTVHVGSETNAICADIFCPVEQFHENI